MEEQLKLEELRKWIEAGDKSRLESEFQNQHPADVAEQLTFLEPVELARYIEVVGTPHALTAFEFVPFEVQKETLAHLSRPALANLISLMSPDDRADLVEELDEETQEKLLSLLIQAERQNIMKLITYEEDTAGAYMTTDYAVLRPDATIRLALEQLRLQAPKKETIYYAYIVDHARKLIGFVSLRHMIMSRQDSKVGDIMSRNVISVSVDDDIEEVAKEMSHYDFLAIPVVDPDNRLVGIVTYDDVFDIMNEEATEDMFLLANLDSDEKLSSPVPRSVKLRVPWLLINLCTATVAAYTVSIFSETISTFVILASMMPIVAGLGGNAGTQTLTVVVRALALGEIKMKGNGRVLLKEISVGLFDGIICGLVAGTVAFGWHRNLWLSLILWMAMTCNFVLAGLLGSLVPITLRKLKLDPALGSSIFVTAATDVGGFFTFLGLSTLFLKKLLG